MIASHLLVYNLIRLTVRLPCLSVLFISGYQLYFCPRKIVVFFFRLPLTIFLLLTDAVVGRRLADVKRTIG